MFEKKVNIRIEKRILVMVKQQGVLTTCGASVTTMGPFISMTARIEFDHYLQEYLYPAQIWCDGTGYPAIVNIKHGALGVFKAHAMLPPTVLEPSFQLREACLNCTATMASSRTRRATWRT